MGRRQIFTAVAAAVLAVSYGAGGSESSAPLIVATTGYIQDAL